MSRMDKYDDNENNIVLSRTQKNQDMYKDVYLNNTFVDYGEINIEEKKEEENVIEPAPLQYEEKNYDINEYLRKAHENRVNDNVNRSLDDTDCEVNKVNEKEDEISKLIASIEEKENEQKETTEFFDNLMPDDDSTIITEPVDETRLEKVIESEEIENYHEEKTDEGEEDFKDILGEKKKVKNSKIPFVIFCVTFSLLIVVIILIFFVKK